jgi:UDP-N-acetylmuramoylalanine--D-glutamate ligase
VQRACIYNVADSETERLVREADVVEGARAIGFTLGTPSVGMVGVVDDVLADRAFVEDRATSAAELCTVGDLASPAPHFVANALAAAALARAHGISQAAVRDGLRAFRPDGHRIETVAVVDGVTWIDDSKATNPHAALAALDGLDRVALIAGGRAKGVDLTPLAIAAPRLAAVVAIGEAAEELVRIFSPLVPTRTAASIEEAARIAFDLAPHGGTVLLAPACASQDMFTDYRERGERFAAAAARIAEGVPAAHG